MSPTLQGVGTGVSPVSAKRAAPHDIHSCCDGCRACKHATNVGASKFILESSTRQVCALLQYLHCRHGWISCLGAVCKAAKQDPPMGSGGLTQEDNRAVTNHQRIWTLIMLDTIMHTLHSFVRHGCCVPQRNREFSNAHYCTSASRGDSPPCSRSGRGLKAEGRVNHPHGES